MMQQIRLMAASLAVVVAGTAFLATSAHAAEDFCDLGTILRVSDAVCDGGDHSITDISVDDDGCSWTVTCH
jgi:hypothetical protein